MFAQLDLWRTAALVSSPLPVLSSDHITSPPSLSHDSTMSRNLSQRNNPSVETPPPLSALHSPQPILDFEPTNPLGLMNNPQEKGSGTSHMMNQLPDISTLQSPTLKSEKFDIYDVLNMLDSGHSMDSQDNKHSGIKREHHYSGPPQYPMFSQAAASSTYEPPLTISSTSNSTLHGTQSYLSTSQHQQMRPLPPLVYSSTQVNPSGSLLITPASFPSSLQIINTSATISSPQQESTQIKQEQNQVISTPHQLSQLLPPPYPGTTVSKMDQSISQTNQQSQKQFPGHHLPEFSKQSQNDADDEDEDLDELPTPASQERNLNSGVTISPVSVPAAPTQNISGRTTTNIHLWQFIKELLLHPELHSSSIHWVDRETGIFKIVDSVRVATLWGKRKNRPAMNYDKLSRSLRQYYKKGIMKKTERTQRLVYQFCHPYHL